MALSYFCLAAAILFGIAGQITLKWGSFGAATLTEQFVNPMTIVGMAIYFLAAVFYIVALNKIPVSVAFPSVAASYAIVAVLAHVLWDEPLGWAQFGGIMLIGSGIILIHQR